MQLLPKKTSASLIADDDVSALLLPTESGVCPNKPHVGRYLFENKLTIQHFERGEGNLFLNFGNGQNYLLNKI